MVTPTTSGPDPDLNPSITFLVDGRESTHGYRFAGIRTQCPALLPLLDDYRDGGERHSSVCQPDAVDTDDDRSESVIRLPDSFWIASQDVTVSIDQHPQRPSLELHGLATCRFHLRDKRQSIIRIRPARSLTQSELTEIILGPLVPLTMAHLGRFLLHSASVETERGVTLICGDSGSGKSTISGSLHRHNKARRLTDDITVLREDSTTGTGAPYPQLKLSGAGWSDQHAAQRRSVNRLVILQRDSDMRGVQVEFADTSETGLALVRHTVAARLFDSRILKLNLALASRWATQLSESGQVLIIRSADDPGLVPEIADRILTA